MEETEAEKSICRLDCCGACRRREECGGCIKTEGRPFGGRCIAAEIIKRDKCNGEYPQIICYKKR